MYNGHNVSLYNILDSCKLKKLLFHVKKHYFWMSIVSNKPFLYTAIDYTKIAPLEEQYYIDTNEWLSLLVSKTLRQFKRVYIKRFDSLIAKSKLSKEIKLKYKKRSKSFQKIWKSHYELGLRLRAELKEIEYPLIYKYKKLVPYLLRKKNITIFEIILSRYDS